MKPKINFSSTFTASTNSNVNMYNNEHEFIARKRYIYYWAVQIFLLFGKIFK